MVERRGIKGGEREGLLSPPPFQNIRTTAGGERAEGGEGNTAMNGATATEEDGGEGEEERKVGRWGSGETKL